MPLEIRRSEIGNDGQKAMIFDMEGSVNSITSHLLGEALNEEIDKGFFRFILVMNQVSSLSTAGIREMISSLKRLQMMSALQNTQAGIRIVAPQERVVDTLEVLGFDELFKIFEDQLTALNSFFAKDTPA